MTTTYHAPIKDMRFVLGELFQLEALTALPAFAELTPDLIDAVLAEAGKFTETVLHPLNLSGDAEGCHYENGVVRTPSGFKEAYTRFVDGGWGSVTAAPEWQGQGLPRTVGLLIEEMICSANLSFGLYPGLTNFAYDAIEAHGTAAQKAIYLPKLSSGAWSGTMCLTEAHAGTDLGLMRTKAIPAENDTYILTGTKIFITGGEHDLTENIVHLVLAKLPDAPPGSRGLSLFLVPKFLPKPDGSLGPRNGVRCGAIEHKMGIKASATAVLNFDDATGWLIGSPHQGLKAMFTMMNAARLGVAIQGTGIAETAYQSAVAYAKERRQSRSLDPKKQDKHAEADPIIVHPDVRRMLLAMRASTEASRALTVWIGLGLDRARQSTDAEIRADAEDFVALMTPIAKAMMTDHGFDAANLAVQVYGGHGYIHEHGIEQLVRDARIAQLYEGTNGIQALDLVGRKMAQHYGRALRQFFHPVSDFIDAYSQHPLLGTMVQGLAKAFTRLQQASATIAERSLTNPEEAGAAACDYLKLFGLVAQAYMWALMAKTAGEKLAMANGDARRDKDFYQAKLATAEYFYARNLPAHSAHFSALMAGGKTLMAMPEAAF